MITTQYYTWARQEEWEHMAGAHHPILGDREGFPDNITSNLGADKKLAKQKSSRR